MKVLGHHIRWAKRLFGRDLAGRLTSWRGRYSRSRWLFDHRNVVCGILAARKDEPPYRINVVCYCTDPYANGFDSSEYIPIFRDGPFNELEEAIRALDREVFSARLKSPESKFFRFLPNQDKCEIYGSNGWESTGTQPLGKRCYGCAQLHEIDGVVCRYCGNLV